MEELQQKQLTNNWLSFTVPSAMEKPHKKGFCSTIGAMHFLQCSAMVIVVVQELVRVAVMMSHCLTGPRP